MNDELLAALSLPELIDIVKRILEELEIRAMRLEASETETTNSLQY